MGEWRKRVSPEEAQAFRDELRKFLEQAPPGSAARMSRIANTSKSTVGNILSGLNNGSTDMMRKLRSAMETLRADPNADASPTPDLRSGPSRKPEVRDSNGRARGAERFKELEPLRKQLRAYFARTNTSAYALGKEIGINYSQLKRFVEDANLRAKAESALRVYLAKHDGTATALVKKPPEQAKLPGIAPPPTDGARVAILTARLNGVKNIPPAPEGGEVSAIIDNFTKEMGMKAIEALLLIEKARRKGE